MTEQSLDAADGLETRAVRNLAAWSVLAALFLFAALAWPFFFGRVYTADDLGAFHLPIRAFYAECLAEGQPFDWMPQLFSGFYLTGEGQAGSYHPFHQILYRFAPLPAALALECLISYPLIMLGTWLWLRRRLGRSDAAAFGGLLFAFCSFNLLHFVHPNAVAVIAHLPWLLWAIDVVLVDSRRRRVAMATAAIALLTGSQLLLGYPQYVWFSLLTEFAYVVLLETSRKYAARSGCDRLASCQDCVGCTTRTWPYAAAAKGIGLLIGGVQLLPSLDALQHSARMSAGPDFTFWGSLHPWNAVQLAAPYLLADRAIGGNVHEFSLYAGAAPLLLCAYLLLRRRELGPLAPLAWASLAFAVFALLLALGQHSLLGRLAARLPFVRSLRFPCRYLSLFQLAISVSAAIGFLLLIRDGCRVRSQRLRGEAPPDRGWPLLGREFLLLWAIVGVSIVVALAGEILLRGTPWLAPWPDVAFGPALLAAAALLIVLTARGYAAAPVALIVLTAFDLGCYGLIHSEYPRSAVLKEYIALAPTPPGKPDGRIFASLLRFDEPGQRTGDLIILSGWRRADGYAGLEPARMLDYRCLPALRTAGVRWVRRNADTDQIAGLTPRGRLWMEVPDPLPRIRLVSKARVSSDPAADIASIPLETTALSELPLGLPESEPGAAALIAESPGRLEIEVACPAPQLLVVAESHHPGWKAEIDGVPQAVHRINGDFFGCVAGPGAHRVIFRFQPESLHSGQLASFLGLCMVSLCFLGCPNRPKPNRMKEIIS